MLDIKLDTTTHDLEFDEDIDLQIIDGIDRLVQKLKIKYKFWFGEWFLDTREGVDYFGEVLGKGKNLNTIDNLMIITATEEPEVLGLLEYSSEIDNATRTLTVDFRAETIYGVLDFSEEFVL